MGIRGWMEHAPGSFNRDAACSGERTSQSTIEDAVTVDLYGASSNGSTTRDHRRLPQITVRHRALWGLVASFLAVASAGKQPNQASSPCASSDWRDICNGRLISDNGGYQDQPQVVVRRDGGWACVLTLNSAHEGQSSQRVVSTVSTDQGQTWTPLVDVEPHVAPHGLVPLTTGWINNLLVPETGRIYAFYTFNCNNVTTAPATGERLPNANLLGCWCYRFSDDGGLSWSPDRYNLTAAQAIADIDRSNAWGGAVLEGWSVGKPLIADDNTTVLMQFSKVSSIAGRSEGFFFRSTTALAPHTPASGGLGFELVPPQPSDPTAPWHGLRAITGTHAEEGSVVQLPRAGSYYAVFRTTNTFLGAATSVDGVSWIDGLIARHDRIDYGPAMYLDKIKQPTGPITPRRFRNGMFLMTVYADQQVYPDLYGFGSRNPYWVVPGWERTGEAAVLWGQPEVLLYTLPPCEDARCGIGYPDFIETETGDIFITETDKVKSRVHPLPASFLTQLWQQGTIAEVAPAGKLIDQEFPAGHTQTVLPAPPWGAVNLSAGGGFAVEVDLNTASIPVGLARGVPLVDCRPSATVPGGAQSGIVVTFTKERVGSSWVHCVNVTMTDSTGRNQSWDTDAEARLWLQQTHRVALSVDGLARVVSSVVNGVFGSGGSQRPQGWAHLDPRITAVGSASGPKCTVHPAVTRLRVYNRYLSTTEMIGNWRADQEK